MYKEIQKLLNKIIFLDQSEKSALIESLPHLSQIDLKRMYIQFARLKQRQDSLIISIFVKMPKVTSKAENLLLSACFSGVKDRKNKSTST